MEINTRKSVSDDLHKYCHLCDTSSFIEVTQWVTGEGFDIFINNNKFISLSYGELDAINYLTKALDYEKD